MALNKVLRRAKIKRRIRKKVTGTSLIPRLSVYRSNKQIYAQLIDDATGKTLA
jgi:large subunit ribosomal protein L18